MQREDGAPRTGGDGTPGPRRRAGDEAAGTDSIRERQRRRRDAGRIQADIETILARPQDEDEEDEGVAPPPGPPPARVYVVFRGAKWQDPDGVLRESDHIAGVFATEEAARRAAAELNKERDEREDAWYQPYPVQE